MFGLAASSPPQNRVPPTNETETTPPKSPPDRVTNTNSQKTNKPLVGLGIFCDVINDEHGSKQQVGHILRSTLEELGAKYCQIFNTSVTHVVFKGGSLKTWEKAQKKPSIYLVSPLWVEACLQHHSRQPEENFRARFPVPPTNNNNPKGITPSPSKPTAPSPRRMTLPSVTPETTNTNTNRRLSAPVAPTRSRRTTSKSTLTSMLTTTTTDKVAEPPTDEVLTTSETRLTPDDEVRVNSPTYDFKGLGEVSDEIPNQEKIKETTEVLSSNKDDDSEDPNETKLIVVDKNTICSPEFEHTVSPLLPKVPIKELTSASQHQTTESNSPSINIDIFNDPLLLESQPTATPEVEIEEKPKEEAKPESNETHKPKANPFTKGNKQKPPTTQKQAIKKPLEESKENPEVPPAKRKRVNEVNTDKDDTVKTHTLRSASVRNPPTSQPSQINPSQDKSTPTPIPTPKTTPTIPIPTPKTTEATEKKAKSKPAPSTEAPPTPSTKITNYITTKTPLNNDKIKDKKIISPPQTPQDGDKSKKPAPKRTPPLNSHIPSPETDTKRRKMDPPSSAPLSRATAKTRTNVKRNEPNSSHCICLSGVSSDDRDCLEQITTSLNGTLLEDIIHEGTFRRFTHLVTPGLRTPKLLYAIATGAQIVTPMWLYACMEARRWVDEREFIPEKLLESLKRRQEAVKRGKLLLQGKTISFIGEFDVGSKMANRLVTELGSRVVPSTSKCDYLIMGSGTIIDADSKNVSAIRVKEKWLLDSIELYQLADPSLYTSPSM